MSVVRWKAFDPAELQELIESGIDGFAPVIINITPLPSVLPLLGLEPQRKEDELEVFPIIETNMI